MNTYAYVGGNPVSRIDPLGLTQEDIDCLSATAKEREPDLDFPDKVGVGDLNAGPMNDGVAGITIPFAGAIYVDDRYLQPLSAAGLDSLYNTIVHEAGHRTLGGWDSIRRPNDHPDIYNDANARQKAWTNAGRPVSNACSCSK